MPANRVALLYLFTCVLFVLVSCGVLVTVTQQVTKDQGSNSKKSTASKEDTQGQQLGNDLAYLRKDVDEAVVRIEAIGDFYSPEEKSYIDYTGTGILLDDSGTLVTNYHVVAGAETIKVYLSSGEKAAGEPRTAKVSGASECFDTAVLDISGRIPTHAIFAETTAQKDSDVHALGYWNGKETLRSGDGRIVQLVTGEGFDGWYEDAIFRPPEHLIFHNAPMKPGSSGGPLVNDAGDVVGVNYSFSETLGYGQSIPAEEIQRFLAPLSAGRDIAYIGIRWKGPSKQEVGVTNYPGLVVDRVDKGSPAGRAGIRPGDIIQSLDDTALAMGRSVLGEYCKILYKHEFKEVLPVQVYRPGDGTSRMGELNGRPLEVVHRNSAATSRMRQNQ